MNAIVYEKIVVCLLHAQDLLELAKLQWSLHDGVL